MNKKRVYWYLIEAVIMVIYNIIFFTLAPKPFSTTARLAYIFIHFSFLLVIVAPFLTRGGKHVALFGVTTISISFGLFLLVFFANMLFVLISSLQIRWVIMTNVVLIGAFLIVLFMNMIANEHTADTLQSQEMQEQYIRGSSARIHIMLMGTDDRALQKKIQKAYDIVHSSPVMVNATAQKYEADVLKAIGEAEDALNNGNYDVVKEQMDQIIRCASARNK